MTRKEVDEFFVHLEGRYPRYEFQEDIVKYWGNKLLLYDAYDVQKNLEILMSDERYQNTPPQLEVILKGLTKAIEKVDFGKQTYFCQFCRRPFNSIELTHIHEDRCSAIRYLERQCRKYNLQELDKRKFYEMSDDEFDERYKKFLKYFQQHTTDELEKERIECIFNLPTKEKAKQIIGGD